MNRLWLACLLFVGVAEAQVWTDPYDYGIAARIPLGVIAADSSWEVAEVITASDVTIHCDHAAGTNPSTNPGVDRGSYYTIDLTAAEMQCEEMVVLDIVTTKDRELIFIPIKKTSPILNCEINTAFFAGSLTTFACILTDTNGAAVVQASNDLEGKSVEIISGADIREIRYINDTTWDGANSELQLTLSRALPSTQADAVRAIIR